MDALAFVMFDPMYFVFVGPAILLALWAEFKVKSAYAQAGRHLAQSGLSGAETAQRILDAYGIHDVRVEPVRTFLGDHYDPRTKTLRLSPEVFHGRSLASLGIAAHEVGHAIQDAHRYAPLAIRNGLVPLASTGSPLALMLVVIGLLMSQVIAIAGLALFGTVVLFQLVNLPVEFNASSRARQILLSHRLITPREEEQVAKVLNAAAMTYVAATVTAILQMLYFASLVFGRRN